MINFKKSREVKTPSRGNPTDAGLDFFIPADFMGGKKFYLPAGESINIPSGIHIEITPGYTGIFFNKSGIAKKGLLIGAQVIDCGYTGEVHLNLHNVSQFDVALEPEQKITQLIILPIESAGLRQMGDDYEIRSFESERKDGAFGSTGIK